MRLSKNNPSALKSLVKKITINERLVKMISALSFVLFSLSLLMLRESLSTGYEISLYRNTPFLVWFSTGLGIVVGVGLIIHDILKRKDQGLWSMGFLMILLNKFLIFSLRPLRGDYFISGSDINMNLGYVRDILNTGHTSRMNIYPLPHFLISQLTLLSDADSTTILLYFPAFLSILCSISLVVVAKEFFKEKRDILLAAILTTAPLLGMFHYVFYTRSYGLILIPLAIYANLESLKGGELTRSHTASFVFLMFGLILMHPLAFMNSFIFLIVVESVKIVSLTQGELKGLKRILRRAHGTLISLAFVAFTAWVMRFHHFCTIRVIYDKYFGGRELLSTWTEMAIGRMEMSLYRKVEFLFKLYGAQAVFGIISLVCLILLLKRGIKKESVPRNLLILGAFCIVSDAIAIAWFFTISGSTMVERSMLVCFSPIFIAYLFKNSFQIPKKHVVKVLSIVVVILLSTSLGIRSLHRSPYLYQMNEQMTYSDKAVGGWVLNHKPPQLLYAGIGFDYNTWYHFLDEPTLRQGRGDLWYNTRYSSVPYLTLIPSHFNYSYHETLGEQLIRDRLLILTQRFYSALNEPIFRSARKVPIQFARFDFTEEDFRNLNQDPTVMKIYTNGESEVFYVQGNKATYLSPQIANEDV